MPLGPWWGIALRSGKGTIGGRIGRGVIADNDFICPAVLCKFLQDAIAVKVDRLFRHRPSIDEDVQPRQTAEPLAGHDAPLRLHA